MKTLKLLIVALLCSAHCVFAQSTTKSLFKKITLVEYDIVGTGKNKTVKIKDLHEITGRNFRLTTVFYKGISDTTGTLPDSTWNALNSFLKKGQPLASYIKVKPIKGFYGAQPSYLSLTDDKGVTQEIFAVESYLPPDFNRVIDMFYRLPFSGTAKYKGKAIKNQELEAKILKAHNACTYLPPVAEPPTVDGF